MTGGQIPVIDLFAGCGGLSEGFEALRRAPLKQFDVRLAVEVNSAAHKSLELRSFFHRFPPGRVPPHYYRFLAGELSLDDLFDAFPDESKEARNRSLQWELGKEDDYPYRELHRRIRKALGRSNRWVLLGGPPCQAYSVVGRVRNRKNTDYDPSTDKRTFLYREYLKILGQHWPSVFLMENVKGVQSSSVNGENIWYQMLDDLAYPVKALARDGISAEPRFDGYRIYSLTERSPGLDIFGLPLLKPRDYIVECEKYGIPQARHRVFVLGVRSDIEGEPGILQMSDTVAAEGVLEGLPRLRSGLTDREDSWREWLGVIKSARRTSWWKEVNERLPDVASELQSSFKRLNARSLDRGGGYVPFAKNARIRYRPDWFLDRNLHGVCNHETRSHMASDLHRYLFAAAYAKRRERPLSLTHFPKELLPQHRNAKDAHKKKSPSDQSFTDRFGAIRANQPSRTIMSHLEKDGHYHIHYDLAQCRSLTPREAARLQTFPDNYFFFGNRGQQYRQIGNAVPPLLSVQIAEIIAKLLNNQ